MRTTILAVCAVIILATPAFSHEKVLAGDRLKGEISIEVVSGRGRALLTIPHRDFWCKGTHVIKKFLEAGKGESYGIVIRNRTPERIGAVIAVDGRNIISGKRSDLRNTEEMYIVSGNEQARYDGWRTDRDTVHRFFFTDTADSYTQRAFQDTSSLGVIAVAVFREQDSPQRLSDMKIKKGLPTAPSSQGELQGKILGASRDEAAGTGFGDEQYSPATRVVFKPEARAIEKTLVKYEWHEVLCNKGILNCGLEPGNRLWNEEEYAPFPPGYKVE